MPRLVSKAITTRTLRLSGYEKEELPSRLSEIVHHPLSPFTKRAFYAIVVLAIVMAVGKVGLMVIEGWALVASFYFMALLATAEGQPPLQRPMWGRYLPPSWPSSQSEP